MSVLALEGDLLIETFTFSFENSNQVPTKSFDGNLFSVLIEGSQIFVISIVTGEFYLAGSVSIDRQTKALEEQLNPLSKEQMDDSERTVQKFVQDLIDFDYGIHPKQYLTCNFRNCFILNSIDQEVTLIWQSQLSKADLSFDRVHLVKRAARDFFVIVDEQFVHKLSYFELMSPLSTRHFITDAIYMIDVDFPTSTTTSFESLAQFLAEERITDTRQSAVDDYCLLLTTKYVCKVPLALTHELDPFTRKDLKPFLYQTPTFYSDRQTLSGLVHYNGRIFVLDTLGAVYETSREHKFPSFKTSLEKQDQLSFKINNEVLFTYDLLDVT